MPQFYPIPGPLPRKHQGREFAEQGSIRIMNIVIAKLSMLERLMRKFASAGGMNRILIVLALLIGHVNAALAQDGGASSSHEGMSMLVLFLGIAGIIGVFVIRWSQSTGDDDEGA